MPKPLNQLFRVSGKVPLRVPLRSVLIVPFVVQVTVAVGLTGWFVWLGGQRTANGLVRELQREIDARIQQELRTYLAIPHLINQINLDASRQDRLQVLETRNLALLENHFWHQIQQFPSVQTIAFASSQGGIVGAARSPEGALLLYSTEQLNPGRLTTYTADVQGRRDQERSQIAGFDARVRPWFRTPVDLRRATWSGVYRRLGSLPSLSISAGLPLLDARGNLQGVLATDIDLAQVGNFLQRIEVRRSGELFIIERSGLLVAASTGEVPFQVAAEAIAPEDGTHSSEWDDLVRVEAANSSNVLVRSTMQYLLQKFDRLPQIQSTQYLDFELAGKRQFVQVSPFQDPYGLDWLVVTVIPEAAFGQPLSDDTKTAILLCGGALGIAIALGLWTANWIAQPILRLNQAAQAIAAGDFTQQVDEQSSVKELGTMAQSFNQMAQQLHVAFARIETALHESEEKFTRIFHASPDPIVISTLAEGRLLEVNDSFLAISGYGASEVIGRTSVELGLWNNPAEREQYRQALQTQGACRNLEFEFRTRSGEMRTMLVSAEIIDIDGEICTLVLSRDISDRKGMEESLRLQAQREQALNGVIQAIRKSLDLDTIFAATTSAISHLLDVDKVSIAQYIPEQHLWRHVAEHITRFAVESTLGLEIPDEQNWVAEKLKQAEVVRLDHSSNEHDMTAQLLQRYPGIRLLVPLSLGSSTWGALSLTRLNPPLSWQDAEVERVQVVADQLAIAIQQSELYQQVQQLNIDLEHQVQERTMQLRTALEFESTLKRITDKVRDSLDEAQILHTAVRELVQALGVECCDTALYNDDLTVSTIYCDYSTGLSSAQGKTIQISEHLEEYKQLLQGQCMQFCPIASKGFPNRPVLKQVSVLASPMIDERGAFGDIWLFKQREDVFSDLEIRLVQQVANQCAIALRQARLYQAAQAQVTELERLNRLKDDFLSTVSHELRSPMANIKMAAQMLELTLTREAVLGQGNMLDRYFQILQEECQREATLIDDLLDLSRLDADTEPLNIIDVQLKSWVLHVVEPFIERAKHQEIQLQLEIPTDLPSLKTDPGYLGRIISELLTNACKYTPRYEYICIRAAADASSMRLEVSNTGVEIPEAEQQRIFDKFYRIPSADPWKHGGTGLGLALVKKLAERLGGSIQLTSQANWVTFILQLPYSL